MKPCLEVRKDTANALHANLPYSKYRIGDVWSSKGLQDVFWMSRSLSVAAVMDRDSQFPRLLEGDPDVGLLVEFKKVNKTGLALITEKDGKRNWKAVDTR